MTEGDRESLARLLGTIQRGRKRVWRIQQQEAKAFEAKPYTPPPGNAFLDEKERIEQLYDAFVALEDAAHSLGKALR